MTGAENRTAVAGGTSTASGSDTPSYQVNFAWQVLQRKADLYVELPLVIPVRVSGMTIAGPAGAAAAASSGPDSFLARRVSALSFRLNPASRFMEPLGSASPPSEQPPPSSRPFTVTPGSRRNSPAFGFGGGIDLRLTRLLSLRGDARDFVTKADLGGVTGRNHGIFQAGFAFHF